MDKEEYIQKDIDINSPDFSILDFNKGEKLIIEFNNLICLGQYELARCLLKEIILVVPKYFEYLYKLIFKNGIPKIIELELQQIIYGYYIMIILINIKKYIIVQKLTFLIYF